ncbi:MAG: DUF2961 domain-containing protein, partial [Verrucomicrobiae bacterium]|nr:DUF2961 domain-containing protein [Verrucomicrobiae bacterium]
LGDFMGFAHGKVMAYESAVHSVGRSAGMNLWLPMPFTKQARFTITNEGEKDVPFFYQIDYTLGDYHPQDTGRLHVLFRRENPTTLKQDFELLPARKGKGRFIGSVMGIRALEGNWWGEGEIKVYLDGDQEFPTICGTGSEDYVGLSWGIQQTPFRYNGCSLDDQGFVSMYRWHLPDPIFWQKAVRITIQQIGWKDGLYERQDDWSCATFWYEPVPSRPLPDVKARTTDLWKEKSPGQDPEAGHPHRPPAPQASCRKTRNVTDPVIFSVRYSCPQPTPVVKGRSGNAPGGPWEWPGFTGVDLCVCRSRQSQKDCSNTNET